jgi:lysozyme family protein
MNCRLAWSGRRGGTKMAEFHKAADFVLKNEDPTLEGKVTPDPTRDDPKAVARFGVNSAKHPEAVTDGFFEMGHDAALQYAEDIFKYDYFNIVRGYAIVDQGIANKLCDLAFNCGAIEATKIVQRALNSILIHLVPVLDVDGLPGARTIGTINACEPERLLPAIKSYAKDFYTSLAAREPWHEKDLQGWLKRVER